MKKGLTLVELLVVISVLGIVSLVVPQILLNVYRFYRINRAQVELQQQARVIMELVTKHLRNAVSDTIKISNEPGEPYYSKIEFQTVDGSTVCYYQSNRKVYQTVNNITKPLSNKNVVYLAFTFPQSYNLGIVSVSFTLEEYVYEIKYKQLHMASEKVRIMN